MRGAQLAERLLRVHVKEAILLQPEAGAVHKIRAQVGTLAWPATQEFRCLLVQAQLSHLGLGTWMKLSKPQCAHL